MIVSALARARGSDRQGSEGNLFSSSSLAIKISSEFNLIYILLHSILEASERTSLWALPCFTIPTISEKATKSRLCLFPINSSKPFSMITKKFSSIWKVGAFVNLVANEANFESQSQTGIVVTFLLFYVSVFISFLNVVIKNLAQLFSECDCWNVF